jgi:Uncharacterized conserved protein
MKYVYPVIFEKDEDKIGVKVPDVKGCYTFGDDLPDAMEMAADALSQFLASMEDHKEAIPVPSELDKINTTGIVTLILADTDEWRKQFDNKAVKKTLSIPSWLNKKAESAGVNFSQILQDALKDAIA